MPCWVGWCFVFGGALFSLSSVAWQITRSMDIYFYPGIVGGGHTFKWLLLVLFWILPSVSHLMSCCLLFGVDFPIPHLGECWCHFSHLFPKLVNCLSLHYIFVMESTLEKNMVLVCHNIVSCSRDWRVVGRSKQAQDIFPLVGFWPFGKGMHLPGSPGIFFVLSSIPFDTFFHMIPGRLE